MLEGNLGELVQHAEKEVAAMPCVKKEEAMAADCNSPAYVRICVGADALWPAI